MVDWSARQVPFRTHSRSGRLIVLEGIDGAGKSTLARLLFEWVQAQGQACVLTKTPSDELRSIPVWKAWNDEALGLERDDLVAGLTVMACGDRLLHQRRIVEPALSRGDWVIVDRYALTSLVHLLTNIHIELCSWLFRPDYGVVVDVSAETAFKRVSSRSYEKIRSDELLHLQTMRQRYLDLARENGFAVVSSEGVSEIETLNHIVATLSALGA
jgi:dTMP kinase